MDCIKLRFLRFWYGKIAKKHMMNKAVSHWGLPDTLKLYYIKNPKKAMTSGELGIRETPWIKMFLLTWLILFVVFTIIGLVTEWQFLYT